MVCRQNNYRVIHLQIEDATFETVAFLLLRQLPVATLRQLEYLFHIREFNRVNVSKLDNIFLSIYAFINRWKKSTSVKQICNSFTRLNSRAKIFEAQQQVSKQCNKTPGWIVIWIAAGNGAFLYLTMKYAFDATISQFLRPCFMELYHRIVFCNGFFCLKQYFGCVRGFPSIFALISICLWVFYMLLTERG